MRIGGNTLTALAGTILGTAVGLWQGNGIANQLIRQCDKKSTETLGEVQSGIFAIDSLERTKNAPFTHLIKIFNTNVDFERSGWFHLLRPHCS